MKTLRELESEIDQILKTQWSRRAGQKVPETDDIQLGNDAVELEATILYADLADSTGLVLGFKDWFAAEVYKCYLRAACELIKNNDGTITAFDGDRVMAVFIGDSRNTDASRCALQVNYVVSKVINPKLKEYYKNTTYEVRQAVGIDTSVMLVARAGVRGSNDLIWIGRSANYAAKLCSLREGSYATFITEAVFQVMNDDVKYGGNPRRLMWEKTMWHERGVAIYRSSWWWAPD